MDSSTYVNNTTYHMYACKHSRYSLFSLCLYKISVTENEID